MVRVTGSETHLARFDRSTGPTLVHAIGAALLSGAEDIADDARHSIIEGSISGKGHVPSNPGEPPNADTHELDQSIEAELVTHGGGSIGQPIKAQARANSHKAAWLEGGTSRMAERPFMGPAARRQRATVVAKVLAAVERVLKGR